MTQDSENTAPAHPTYVAPQVLPLGAWDAVTLAQSVPIGPGSLNLPNPFQSTGETW
ncbi:hypothetical protein K7W42_15310 [Deinococcus sp. HMF7604]|uniref:hypothetical protein n=1 Tax=Deinococcus betulae TaxID=2873312 RepID=UPI001CC9E54E|nr:hypothetical protein [Deinococcus betulae]MBZ9752222.1 hypothetical protein [Deinococcus betulae]